MNAEGVSTKVEALFVFLDAFRASSILRCRSWISSSPGILLVVVGLSEKLDPQIETPCTSGEVEVGKSASMMRERAVAMLLILNHRNHFDTSMRITTRENRSNLHLQCWHDV